MANSNVVEKGTSMTIAPEAPAFVRTARITRLSLDISRACQLACGHCYNESGPRGDHGAMTRGDWLRVVTEAAAYGIRDIQVIGGEPTLHPDGPAIVRAALAAGITVEVFTNLVSVPTLWWDILQTEGVRVATSYYSADPAAHDRVTRRRSHARSESNIVRALARGIPLRAGVVRVHDAQDTDRAVAHLHTLGVAHIGIDDQRPYGRVGNSQDPARLCGRCGVKRASIDPDGCISPCTLSTWMRVGNVRETPLAAILDSDTWTQVTATIQRAVLAHGKCEPDSKSGGGSGGCDPGCECQPDAYPCYPSNE